MHLGSPSDRWQLHIKKKYNQNMRFDNYTSLAILSYEPVMYIYLLLLINLDRVNDYVASAVQP